MKKIAIVVKNSMIRCGVTSVVLNLLRNIDRTTLKITLLSTLKVEDWFLDELSAMNVDFVSIKASNRNSKVFEYIGELSLWLKNNKIDVLHVHGNSATMWFEIFAAKSAGVNVRIAHSHSSSCLSKCVHYMLRPLLIKDMTLGIGCSDLSEKFSFNDKKSIVLPNGIDTDRFCFDEQSRNECRESLGISDKFAIGHVGNFFEVKNHTFMCKLAAELIKRGNKGFQMLFIGKGEKQTETENCIKENSLDGYIKLLGSRADVDMLYHAMDLFILPSLYEGFPMVLVEAQTSGLNCLISDKVTKTTNLLGTAEYLSIDKENSVKGWADAIEQAMKNKPDDRSSAKAIVDKAGYSVCESAKKLEILYRNGGQVYEG